MAGDGTVFGPPLVCDMERAEDDTDDISFHFTNADGSDATIVGWTGTLTIGSDQDTILVLVPPVTVAYTGVGIAAGILPINMDGFDVPIGNYRYDLRVIDTVSGDTPARVYVRGKFKVTARIN